MAGRSSGRGAAGAVAGCLYDDETGLWEYDGPASDGGWEWPRGRHSASFAVYDFPGTAGSFKAHFWAGERWEMVREHADPLVRAELDAFLGGLIWLGMDGEAERREDSGFFHEDPAISYGLLLSLSPDGVRKMLTTWERVRPRLGGLREVYDEHAAMPDGWISDFASFARLLDSWGHVLAEAARRGWAVVGLSE